MKNPTLLKEMLDYRGRDEMPDDFDTFALGLGIRLVLFSCRKMLEQTRKS